MCIRDRHGADLGAQPLAQILKAGADGQAVLGEGRLGAAVGLSLIHIYLQLAGVVVVLGLHIGEPLSLIHI